MASVQFRNKMKHYICIQHESYKRQQNWKRTVGFVEWYICYQQQYQYSTKSPKVAIRQQIGVHINSSNIYIRDFILPSSNTITRYNAYMKLSYIVCNEKIELKASSTNTNWKQIICIEKHYRLEKIVGSKTFQTKYSTTTSHQILSSTSCFPQDDKNQYVKMLSRDQYVTVEQ